MDNPFHNLSLYELAQKVKQRPQMFFGKELRLSELAAFLFGYGLHPVPVGDIPFEYFNRWTKHKLNTWGSNHNWVTVILKACNADEEKAFWLFFDLLEEFNAARPLSMHAVSLTEANFEFYYSRQNTYKNSRFIESRRIVYPAPYHIKLIEFEHGVLCYHFGMRYELKESKAGIHEATYNTLSECLSFFEKQYGSLEWMKLPDSLIAGAFSELIASSDHHRARF